MIFITFVTYKYQATYLPNKRYEGSDKVDLETIK